MMFGVPPARLRPSLRRALRAGLSAALLAVVAAALPPAGDAQEVMSFINMQNLREIPRDVSPADLEFLRMFVPGAEPATLQGTSECIWRSPLATPGAYADAAFEMARYVFYARVPFPRANHTFQGFALAGRSDFPRVAFLEFQGYFQVDDVRERPRWVYARVVLPPLTTPGEMFDPITYAVITGAGVTEAIPGILRGPPGLPTVLSFSTPTFERMLQGLEQNPAFIVEAGRLPDTDAPAPRLRVEASFPNLPADLRTILAKVADMRRRQAAGTCQVHPSECVDGRCG